MENPPNERFPEKITIENTEFRETESEAIFTITVSRDCDLAELRELWETPESLIQSNLRQKGWLDETGKNLLPFKMNVLKKRNEDGTFNFILKYYLSSERN
jgi:hypothetical protein